MRIANNIMALNAHRQLMVNQGGVAKSIEKLSSGLRINRAGDDAAGLAISEKMRGQIRGLNQATRNAQDAISLIQTAEGALTETHAILQRMRELAVQSATDTNTEVDRSEIQKEINQLAEELSRIADTTEFNTQNLLGGKFQGTFHIGANQGQKIELEIGDMGAEALKVTGQVADYKAENNTAIRSLVVSADAAFGQPATDTYTVTEKITYASESSSGANDGAFTQVEFSIGTETVTFTAQDIANGILTKTVGNFEITIDASIADTTGNGAATGTSDDFDVTTAGINVSSQRAADEAITTINDAIETVSAERSKLGAMQNRLEHTIANLGASAENLQAAESRIRDVDMAAEMMQFTKFQILQQASTAMLAQANLAPQSVLQLLG